MADLFEGEVTETPGPRIQETPWAPGIREWMQNLISQQAPLQQIEGMTPTEQQGQGILSSMLRKGLPEGYQLGMSELQKTLSGAYDPSTSDYYQGLRTLSQQEEEQGVSNLRRGSQLGGMFYSEPSTRTEAGYRNTASANRQSLLGSLYESERQKQQAAIPQALQYGQYAEQQPYRQLGAIQQYGSLPRDIQNQQGAAEYQQQLFPYNQQAQLAQFLMQYQPWYQPQFTQEESPFSQILGGAAQILPYAMAPFTGGASLMAAPLAGLSSARSQAQGASGLY